MLEHIKDENKRVLEGISALEQRLPFRISVLSRLLDRQMGRILARHDLTLAAYRVLITIQAFGGITSSELTRYSIVDRALISRKVAELLNGGLIGSRTDPKDTRRKWLHLTKAGEAKIASLEPDTEKRSAGLSGQLAPGESEELVGFLEKLTNHVARDLEITSRAE